MRISNDQKRKLLLLTSLVVIMGLTLACSLPFSLPGQPASDNWQPQEEPFQDEEPHEEPFMEEEPHPEDPDMHEEPHPEESMGEEPHPEEPQHEEPMPESEGQQPQGEEEVPFTDLAITDIYPGNLPQGNLFVRITNNGPTVLLTYPVELTCHARGHRWANQPGEDNKSNTVELILQVSPGQTSNENTGIPIDANLYEYEVECSINAEIDNTPHNNTYFEVIPNP